MTDKRRITLIVFSVLAGTFISAFIFYKRHNSNLTITDYSTLIFNLVISLALILGIGYIVVWRKKKE